MAHACNILLHHKGSCNNYKSMQWKMWLWFYSLNSEVKSHAVTKGKAGKKKKVKQLKYNFHQIIFFPVKALPACVICYEPHPNSLSRVHFMLRAREAICCAVVPSESLPVSDVCLEEGQYQTLFGMLGNVIRLYIMYWEGLLWSNKHTWQLRGKY